MFDTGGDDDNDDPFACFDDEDPHDDVANEAHQDGTKEGATTHHTEEAIFEGERRRRGDGSIDERVPLRDPTCGVLAFHSGTEIALLHHVKMMRLAGTTAVNNNRDHISSISLSLKRAADLLDWIDDFCLHRHWMMHIGKEKGEIIRNFIVECLTSRTNNNFFSSSSRSSMKSPSNGDEESETTVLNSNRVVFVELGTYCGYSAIFMAKTILEYYNGGRDTPTLSSSPSLSLSQRFKVYTVEVVEQHAKVAKELIHLSGMEPYIDVLLIDPENDNVGGTSSLTMALHDRLVVDRSSSSPTTESKTPPVVDFLFLDHDKDLYLHDLQTLERAGLIRTGTFVAADNVVFAQIDNYRQYMTALSRRGIVQTRLVESLVEYSQPDLDYSVMKMKSDYDDDDGPSSGETQKTEIAHHNILKDGIELSLYLCDPLPCVPTSSR